MLARVLSAALVGVEARLVRVEVDVSSGLPSFTIVGLPDASVRESRDRVRAAIKNAGFDFPIDRITVNLAPASVRKEGAAFDLPIALGILRATKALAALESDPCVVGELGLDGAIHSGRGVLAIALTCRRRGVRMLLVAPGNAAEAAAVPGVRTVPVATLRDVASFFIGEYDPPATTPLARAEAADGDDSDFAEVRGQAYAKRALEIAAAGGHNVLMVGPPGAGKTMLARRLSTVLPPLSLEQAVEVSTIWSVAGLTPEGGTLVKTPPFRAPHHSLSEAGLIGGGSYPQPGEVSLAHHGVLFLDEIAEFPLNTIESLRQPLEDGEVVIARAAATTRFPARFQLVAAMNPCRRGCRSFETCLCTPAERERYRRRLSRPLLDRIDMHLELGPVSFTDMAAAEGSRPAAGHAAESSVTIRERVVAARERQRARLTRTGTLVNAQLTPRQVRRFCRLPADAEQLLERAMTRLGLSARGYDRILRVARTIADLAARDDIAAEHCAEAIQYRAFDRQVRF